jgi:hypothetical protein
VGGRIGGIGPLRETCKLTERSIKALKSAGRPDQAADGDCLRRILPLVFTRPGEPRTVTGAEFDLDGPEPLGRRPGERVKMPRKNPSEHRSTNRAMRRT